MYEETNKTNKSAQVRADLLKGVREVFESANYKSWLDCLSKFHQYSVRNRILIMMQNPGATQVASYKTWQKLGRHVKRGEHGLSILCPCPLKKRYTEADGEEVEYNSGIFFKAGTVFDISQTDGDPLPEICEELNGIVSDYDATIKALVKLAPCPVYFEDPVTHGALGVYSPVENKISVKPGMAQDQTVKTLVHELAHSLLHSDPKIAETLSREQKEVEAESVAYWVCNELGIDTGDYSFGYIAGWATGQKDSLLLNCIGRIQKTAEQILAGI